MSYHFQICKETYSENLTYNLSKMLRVAWETVQEKEQSLKSFDTWKTAIQDWQYGKQALSCILSELINRHDYYATMNPENGWGNVDSAIQVFHNVLQNYDDDSRLILE